MFCLVTCFDVGSGSSVDHASGGVGGVLASPTTTTLTTTTTTTT